MVSLYGLEGLGFRAVMGCIILPYSLPYSLKRTYGRKHVGDRVNLG